MIKILYWKEYLLYLSKVRYKMNNNWGFFIRLTIKDNSLTLDSIHDKDLKEYFEKELNDIKNKIYGNTIETKDITTRKILYRKT